MAAPGDEKINCALCLHFPECLQTTTLEPSHRSSSEAESDADLHLREAFLETEAEKAAKRSWQPADGAGKIVAALGNGVSPVAKLPWILQRLLAVDRSLAQEVDDLVPGGLHDPSRADKPVRPSRPQG